jgi:glycosyltransferase involved in cell wall biosynthesis
VRILSLSDIRFPLERANGIQTMETAHALAARGHQVTLLVRPDTSPVARDPFAFYGLDALDALQVTRVDAWGGPPARRAMYLAAAVWHARSSQYDLVFTRDLGIAAALLRVARGWRAPLVYEAHGMAAVVGAALGDLLSSGRSAPPRKQRRLARREQYVWQEADGYVTITSALAHDLEAQFGPRGPLAVVADGVRLPRSRTFVEPRATAGPLVVYAGHLYPWKGVHTLLHALAELPSARGLIVGGHPAEDDLPRLRALADTLEISSRVTFTGLVPHAEVAPQLQRADVLVLPNSATTISSRYTSPLKLFEYLAAGRPIVASDLPALREVLRDRENAWLVPPDDARALADAIAGIAADAGLAGRLARAAFDDAAPFTWAARAARLEALFDQVRRQVRGSPPAR